MTEYNEYWNNDEVCEMLEALWALPQYDDERDRIARKILNDCKGNLLEIGSGDGTLYKFMKNIDENIQNRYNSIDFSERLLNKFKERFPEVNAKYGDAENLNFEDESFDGIIIYDILRHQPDYTVILKEALRVSKRYLFIAENFLSESVNDRTNGKDVNFTYGWKSYEIHDNWILRKKFKDFILSLFPNSKFDESIFRLIVIDKCGE